MTTFKTWMGEPIEAICYPDYPAKPGRYPVRITLKSGKVLDEVVGDYEMNKMMADGDVRRCRAIPRLQQNSLPEDPAKRNQYPMADGLLDYFPNALAEVSRVSFIGNQQHNPGEPMHWARGKSTDHRNKMMRHLIDAGGFDQFGVRHSAALAWRALANLQEELEREEGSPLPRGATPPEEK